MKIIIVDNRDNIIGAKERKDVDPVKDIYRLSALWLTNSKGQVLLAKRSMLKDKDPGMWGPAVAGTNDEGETYEKNIYKEAKEEIGLEGRKFTKGPKMRLTNPRNYFCQWYFLILDRDINSFIMQKDEVDKLAWVDIEQMKQDFKLHSEKYTGAFHQILEGLGV
jgi:isopentenyldiphosphate isomerase